MQTDVCVRQFCPSSLLQDISATSCLFVWMMIATKMTTAIYHLRGRPQKA